MEINDYANRYGEKAKEMIYVLLSSIPSSLVPKNGFPDFHLTNSLFHSYGVMYQKYKPTGLISEEEFYRFCDNQHVWAFSCLNNDEGGDVYLALEKRISGKYPYTFSIEHVIFHEMGHHFYYQKGVELASVIDIDHEKLSDIYANACMLNYFLKEGNPKGYYFPFNQKSVRKIKNELRKKLEEKDLLIVAEKIYRDFGVL